MIMKKFVILTLIGFVLSLSVPALSHDSVFIDVNQRIETKPEDIPHFTSPVCLLVGLNSPELAYREVSALSGFELFSVPYRSDIKILVDQINPTQIIIKHPSGFVGLYTTEGQLIRGIETVRGTDIALAPHLIPPSIVQPVEGDPLQSAIHYPGSLTGGIPHGGIGYVEKPKGRNTKRHLLKIAALAGLAPYQYPGFFEEFHSIGEKDRLVPFLFVSSIPQAISAVSTVVDAKLDEKAYEEARTQPRHYKFQPVIEGY